MSADPSYHQGVVLDSPKTYRSFPKPHSIPPSNNQLSVLRKLAQDFEVFNPESPGNNIELHLKDVDFALSYLPEATMADKLLLLRKTTARAVHSFMERQSHAISTNYNELCKALIAEYTLYENPSASRLSAFEIKQGRHESPREYYERLRKMYFAGRDDPRAEEDVMFKSLFVNNLYPTVRKPLSLLVDTDSMSAGELRRLAMQAWYSGNVGTDRKGRQSCASVLKPSHDSKTPFQLEEVSELHQNRFASQSRSFDLQHGTQDPTSSGAKRHKNSRNVPARESRQSKDRRERQRKVRNHPENNQKQGKKNRTRATRGTKRNDDEDLAEIRDILLEALKDRKSEEHISADTDLVSIT